MTIHQKFLVSYLKRFDEISFSLKFHEKEPILIGSGQPQFEVLINGELDENDLLKSTSLTLAEAYIKGTIEINGDLFQSLSLFLSQIEKFHTNRKSLKHLLHTSSNRSNQFTEVSSHYDIGNDFYKLWLDPTLSYSCAYFKNDSDSLQTAQEQKIDLTLKKLNLKEGMSLLDVGCGWGGLLITAAKKYKIHGIGITLSKEQETGFMEQIKEEHLEDLLEVRLMDYRDLSKSGLSFDRIVSVGMIEHVSRENFNLFYKELDSVLKPGGLFLLHFISALKEYSGDPFIKKYIFPGGMIPSLREIIYLAADYRYYTVDVESLRRHYIKTLLCWRDNFNQGRETILSMFDNEFVRMWDLYLCSCAAAFYNGIIDVHQILFSKGPIDSIPMTRDYLYKK